DAFAHALKWRGTERERTWRVDGQDGPARAPDLLGPPSCLRTVGMLLGSRSGAPHKSGGPSAAGEVRAWLRDTLAGGGAGPKGVARDREVWELAIELYREGFFEELPDRQALGGRREGLWALWQDLRGRYLGSGLIPNETFIAGCDQKFKELFGPEEA